MSSRSQFLLLALILAVTQLFSPAAARCAPVDDGFRLIFVGSLSGYVKLCG